MTAFDVPGIESSDFGARAWMGEGGAWASLDGNADLRSHGSLGEFLTRLHREVERLGLDEVTVDLRELKFMNSSCFKSLISWITLMQDMASDRRYKVAFVSNPAMHWQKRSLHALCCFADELVTVRS